MRQEFESLWMSLWRKPLIFLPMQKFSFPMIITFPWIWILNTDSTKINRPGHNIRMYLKNFRQPTAHLQHDTFGKTLIDTSLRCRKFVQYIRMLCPGRFFLVESVFQMISRAIDSIKINRPTFKQGCALNNWVDGLSDEPY